MYLQVTAKSLVLLAAMLTIGLVYTPASGQGIKTENQSEIVYQLPGKTLTRSSALGSYKPKLPIVRTRRSKTFPSLFRSMSAAQPRK